MAKKKSVSVNKSSMVISITVPSEGISLKVNNTHGFVLGTLNITHDGVKFIKVKAKKVPQRVLTWEILSKLAEVGLT